MAKGPAPLTPGEIKELLRLMKRYGDSIPNSTKKQKQRSQKHERQTRARRWQHPGPRQTSWRLRYRVNGERFETTVTGTKADAKKALRNLLHTGDTGEHVAPDRMTVGQWIEHWISIGCPGNKKRMKVSERTIERYAELLRVHVVPTLSDRPLQQLQGTEIDSLYVKIAERVR